MAEGGAMTVIASGIVYGAPQMAFLLLAAPAMLLLYRRLARERQQALLQFVGPNQEGNLALARTNTSQVLRAALFALSWMAASLALMLPAWQSSLAIPSEGAGQNVATQKSVEVERLPHDVIFVLDTSASMSVADTTTGQTRLDSARGLISDTIARLTSENTGLSVFTSTLKPIVPATLDHLYLLMLLQDVGVNATGVAGTDFRQMLGELQKAYWERPSDKLVSVIVISDGGDTSLQDISSKDQEAYIHTIVKQLKDVNVSQRRIYTVGMGSTQPATIPGMEDRGRPVQAPLKEELLKKLAKVGQGSYFRANDYEASELSDLLSATLLENAPKPVSSQSRRTFSRTAAAPSTPLFGLFVILAFALLMAALILPEVEQEGTQDKGKRIVT